MNKKDPKTNKKKNSEFSNLLKGKVSQLEIIFAIRYLSLMLKSGVALEDALAAIAIQSSDKRLQEIFNKIAVDINNGVRLSTAMNKYRYAFSDIIISIIKIGEQTGTLEINLNFLAEYLKKKLKLQKKIRGALTYPFIIIGITGIELIGMVYFILPRLENLFSAFDNTPAFTQFILTLASWIRNNTILTISSFAVLGLLGFLFIKTPPGRRFKDRLLISFPIIKRLTRNNIVANFARTVGVLMESGIPISLALKITAETVNNSVYEKILNDVHLQVQGGTNLAVALQKYDKYFPITFIKMIESGEKSGTLEENLKYLYEYLTEEVEDMADNLTKLLEPILLVFVTVIIGVLALTVIAPMYQLSSTINQ